MNENGLGDVCDLFDNSNFGLKKSDPTCIGKNNGSVSISAIAHFDYNLILTGPNGFVKEDSFNHKNDITITNLAKGKYKICITSPINTDFERCYATELFEPDPLNVVTQLNAADLSLIIDLSGGQTYKLKLNENHYELKTGRHHLYLKSGLNILDVTTDLNCQGNFVKEIYVSENSNVYPNPASETVNILVGGGAMEAQVLFFNLQGELLYHRNLILNPFNRSFEMPVDYYPPGIYLIRVITEGRIENFKLLRH